MAEAKRDNNFVTTLLGVTDDANLTPTNLVVDPTTKRLKVSAIIAGGVISSLNGLTTATQLFAVGSTGSQFAISSSGSTHTFNLPNSSSTGTGQLSAADWLAFNAKLVSINALTTPTQLFAVGSTGNQFNVSSSGSTHTFNLPTASASGTGQLTAADWTAFNSKLVSINAITTPTQLFAVGSGGNQFNISSSGSTHTFNLPTASAGGTGQLTAADWSTFNGKLSDAASDGTTYGRQNATWVAIVSGSGLLNLNGLTDTAQTFSVSSTGSQFAIESSGSTHTFVMPSASASGTGQLSAADWTTFNNKMAGVANSPLEYASGSLSLGTLTVNSPLEYSSGSLSLGTLTVNSPLEYSAGSMSLGSITSAYASNKTGTGDWVLAVSPALTGTVTAESLSTTGVITSSGTLSIPESGVMTLGKNFASDEKYSGIVSSGTAGAALTVGQCCYLQTSDSRWELADASGTATANKKLGMCIQTAGADGSPTTMLLYGNIRSAYFPTFTVGEQVYISESEGTVTSVQPTTANAVIRVVGFANTADELFFCPSPDYIVHT